jgi:hypothetical protein
MLAMCAVPLVPDDVARRAPLPMLSADLRSPASVGHDTVSQLRRTDTPLIVLWVAASAALLAAGARGSRRLLRLRGGWKLWRRAGFSTPATWLSESTGPAAFGATRSEIVIPRWALSLPSADRRLLLAHERAHVVAQDPQVMALGMVLVVLMPWNLPLRWAYRRMQRAIEYDCDRRVLDRPNTTRRYAELLLSVAERGLAAPVWTQRALGTSADSVSMTSLFAGAPDLESRLRALVKPAVTFGNCLRAAAVSACAVAIILVAWALPVPRAATQVAPSPTHALLARGHAATRDPLWIATSSSTAAEDKRRNRGDSVVLARDDSLVIDAIERSKPTLLSLAATPTPFVAIALNASNEVVAHSIAAGQPAGRARIIDATVPATREDDEFAGRLALVANSPARFLDSLGISHLQVGDRALTVLWMRFRQATGD